MKKATLMLAAAWLLGSAVPVPAGEARQPEFHQLRLGEVEERTRAWGIGLADFNGDGLEDIICGDTFGDLHLFLGLGDGKFQYRGIVVDEAFHDAYALATGDFNLDGRKDFVLCRTGGAETPSDDGIILLYPGNGDGTFREGLAVGDAGTDVMSLAAADVDGDGDVDLVAGDVAASDNSRADVTLFRNLLQESLYESWTSETVISAAPLNPPDPEQPPYFPPKSYLNAYGLALGDVDEDGDPDLLVGDVAGYLYLYENDGAGRFSPVRYGRLPTRPFVLVRLRETFTSQPALAAEDFNLDGRVDFVCATEGEVVLWLNDGLDAHGRVGFTTAGVIGGAGTGIRGLAAGRLNPVIDSSPEVVFGNFEGDLYGLFADLVDTAPAGIADRPGTAPVIPDALGRDMKRDGGIPHLNRPEKADDGGGRVAKEDGDKKGVPDAADSGPEDVDGEGHGEVGDPLFDADIDGVSEGPADPDVLKGAVPEKSRGPEKENRMPPWRWDVHRGEIPGGEGRSFGGRK